eukprot:EG_transcript_25641
MPQVRIAEPRYNGHRPPSVPRVGRGSSWHKGAPRDSTGRRASEHLRGLWEVRAQERSLRGRPPRRGVIKDGRETPLGVALGRCECGSDMDKEVLQSYSAEDSQWGLKRSDSPGCRQAVHIATWQPGNVSGPKVGTNYPKSVCGYFGRMQIQRCPPEETK